MLRKLLPGILELLLLEAFFFLIALSFYRFFPLSKLVETALLASCLFVSFFERDKKTAGQNAVILLTACLIWYGAIFSSDINNNEHPRFVAAGAILLTLSLVFSLFHSEGRTDSLKDQQSTARLPGTIGIITIAAVFMILSIPSLTELPILDSGAYYGWMRRVVTQFDFTFREMPYYCFYDHLSPGYGLLVLMGELWNGGTGVGLHAVNLVISLLSIFAFFDLTGINQADTADNPTSDDSEAPGFTTLRLLLTSCYAFHPAVLGLSGNISLDLPLIPLSILVIWAYITENEILFAFLSWVFVLTKEPAVVYFFLMCSAILVYECRTQSLKVFFRTRYLTLISGLSAGLWWIVYYLAPGRGAYGMAGELFISEGEDMHGFGFTFQNLMGKAGQSFILDFNWLILAAILVLVIIILKDRISLSHKASRILVLSSALGAGVFLFNILYLDYMHPRYMLVFEAPLLLIASTLAVVSYRHNRITPDPDFRIMIPLLCLSILLLSQSFACTDILTRRVLFHDSRSPASAPFSSFGDGKVYNRESSYPVKALEKALGETGLNPGEKVYVPGLDLTGYDYSGGRVFFSDSGDVFVKDMDNADIMVVMPWQSLPDKDLQPEEHPETNSWKETRCGTVTVRYKTLRPE